MVSSSQSLCLTCGLCCDGTLFSSVRLKQDDKVAPLKAVDIKFISNEDSNEFKQPCAAHKNCTCTVYRDRPQECRAYKCELLKRFERNDISYKFALEIINKMISLKNEVNALARAASTNTQSAEEIILLMKKWSKDRSIEATKQSYAHVFLKFGVLQIYLDRFFRKKPLLAPPVSASDSPSKSPN